MKKGILFIGLAVAMLLSACSTTENYVSSYQSFVKHTDANCAEYSIHDWSKSMKKFKTYSIDKFKTYHTKLTPKQRKQVIRLDAQYVGIAVRENITQIKNFIEDLRTVAPEVATEVLNGIFSK
jgi:hypothetical protein